MSVRRPLPGPPDQSPLPSAVKPRYVDVDDVAYIATCDRGPHDAVWRKTRDAVRPTCTCPCPPEGDAGASRAEHVLPKRVPIPCWRCGVDCESAFAVIRLPGHRVFVCKGGCAPTVVARPREA